MGDWQPPAKDDAWASQFICPCHGRCTERMVMTTKCCGICAADGHTEGLIRDVQQPIPLFVRLIDCHNCEAFWRVYTVKGKRKNRRIKCPSCHYLTRWMVA